MSLAFQKVGGSRGVAQCHSHPYTSPIRRLISLEAAELSSSGSPAVRGQGWRFVGMMVQEMLASVLCLHRVGCTGWSCWMTTVLALVSWWW